MVFDELHCELKHNFQMIINIYGDHLNRVPQNVDGGTFKVAAIESRPILWADLFTTKFAAMARPLYE